MQRNIKIVKLNNKKETEFESSRDFTLIVLKVLHKTIAGLMKIDTLKVRHKTF